MRVSGTGERSAARVWRDRRGGSGAGAPWPRDGAALPRGRSRAGAEGAGLNSVLPRGLPPSAPPVRMLPPLRPALPGAPLCPSPPAPFPQPRRSPCGSYEPGGVGIRGRGPSGGAGARGTEAMS